MKLFIKTDLVTLPYVGRAVRALAPKARTARPTAAKIIFSLTLLILLFSMNISYGDESTVTIKKADRCPVCGMFVYKYPKWVAQIIFKEIGRASCRERV